MNLRKSYAIVLVAFCMVSTAALAKSKEQCGPGSARLCASHGATCDLVHDRSGESSEVCRWSKKNDAAACKATAGIWTSNSSKYARNHADAVRAGDDGACITELKNIKASSTRQPTDQKIPGLATPSELSVSNVSSTSLVLSWTDNSESEFGVEVYRIDPVAARSGQGGDWELIGLFEERNDTNVKSTGQRSDRDSDLTPDTRYCYRLRAYMGFDRSRLSGFSESVCAQTSQSAAGGRRDHRTTTTEPVVRDHRDEPVGVIELSPAECRKLGGKVAALEACNLKRACYTTDQHGGRHAVCITRTGRPGPVAQSSESEQLNRFPDRPDLNKPTAPTDGLVAVPLTRQECKGLGGDITSTNKCGDLGTCITVDEHAVVRVMCITEVRR